MLSNSKIQQIIKFKWIMIVTTRMGKWIVTRSLHRLSTDPWLPLLFRWLIQGHSLPCGILWCIFHTLALGVWIRPQTCAQSLSLNFQRFSKFTGSLRVGQFRSWSLWLSCQVRTVLQVVSRCALWGMSCIVHWVSLSKWS